MIKKLRVFCVQFGYDMPYPQNIENHQIKQKYYKNKYPKKQFYAQKIFLKKKNTHSTIKNLPICFKCRNIGHYKSKCRIKQKIKELNIDKGLKRQLLQVLINGLGVLV